MLLGDGGMRRTSASRSPMMPWKRASTRRDCRTSCATHSKLSEHVPGAKTCYFVEACQHAPQLPHAPNAHLPKITEACPRAGV